MNFWIFPCETLSHGLTATSVCDLCLGARRMFQQVQFARVRARSECSSALQLAPVTSVWRTQIRLLSGCRFGASKKKRGEEAAGSTMQTHSCQQTQQQMKSAGKPQVLLVHSVRLTEKHPQYKVTQRANLQPFKIVRHFSDHVHPAKRDNNHSEMSHVVS